MRLLRAPGFSLTAALALGSCVIAPDASCGSGSDEAAPEEPEPGIPSDCGTAALLDAGWDLDFEPGAPPVTSGSPHAPSCPPQSPAVGATCAVGAGPCSYEFDCAVTYTCCGGVWVGIPYLESQCPADDYPLNPWPGDPCCIDPGRSCSFTSGFEDCGRHGSELLVCVGGTWESIDFSGACEGE